jgi:hypothetical protein
VSMHPGQCSQSITYSTVLDCHRWPIDCCDTRIRWRRRCIANCCLITSSLAQGAREWFICAERQLTGIPVLAQCSRAETGRGYFSGIAEVYEKSQRVPKDQGRYCHRFSKPRAGKISLPRSIRSSEQPDGTAPASGQSYSSTQPAQSKGVTYARICNSNRAFLST